MDIKHLAIIMDGNGRWATKRNLSRNKGHFQGVETVRKIIRHVKKRNIEYLTLYAFSTENFKRPKLEVSGLMNLVKIFFQNDIEELNSQGVRVRILGNKDLFSRSIKTLITKAEDITKNNSKLNVNFAFGYGSRQEILTAVNKIIEKNKGEVNVEEFESELYTSNMPDVDLLIRTGGEKRISNFLLYQIAYSELYFSDVLWPDYTEEDLDKALDEYSNRKRRFGGL